MSKLINKLNPPHNIEGVCKKAWYGVNMQASPFFKAVYLQIRYFAVAIPVQGIKEDVKCILNLILCETIHLSFTNVVTTIATCRHNVGQELGVKKLCLNMPNI